MLTGKVITISAIKSVSILIFIPPDFFNSVILSNRLGELGSYFLNITDLYMIKNLIGLRLNNDLSLQTN